MINSHDGQLSIEGNRAQVLFDFAHIYDEMISIAPEIVQAVVIFRDKELLNAEVDRRSFCNLSETSQHHRISRKRGHRR